MEFNIQPRQHGLSFALKQQKTLDGVHEGIQAKLADINSFIRCSKCLTALGRQHLKNHDHPGGLELDNFDEKQWIYYECPICEKELSLDKIRRIHAHVKVGGGNN